MGIRRLAATAAAVVVVLATAAFAFENTSWNGDLECKAKARVKQGDPPSYLSETVQSGVGLSTQNTTWSMSGLTGGTLPGDMAKRNDHNYRIAHPDPTLEPTESQAFLDWVKAKILASNGLDVDLLTASMKGTFVLDATFDNVKVNLKVKWTGTVASGPDAGKAVRGTIKLKGVLPRVLT